MKFEINSQHDYKGEDAPWGITGFNMHTETRMIEGNIRSEVETFWVIEINSIEELLELCKQLKPRVMSGIDIAIYLPGNPEQYPLIRIHDSSFE